MLSCVDRVASEGALRLCGALCCGVHLFKARRVEDHLLTRAVLLDPLLDFRQPFILLAQKVRLRHVHLRRAGWKEES